MKKKRKSKINSFAVITLIISFICGFFGVLGINNSIDFGNTTLQTQTLESKNDDQDFVYKNWVNHPDTKNNYEVQTEIIPSESLIDVNGVYQINSLEDWLYCCVNSVAIWPSFSLNCDITLNDGYFDDDGTYHDGGDGVCYISSPFVGGAYITSFEGNGHTITGFYIDDHQNITHMNEHNLYLEECNLNIKHSDKNAFVQMLKNDREFVSTEPNAVITDARITYIDNMSVSYKDFLDCFEISDAYAAYMPKSSEKEYTLYNTYISKIKSLRDNSNSFAAHNASLVLADSAVVGINKPFCVTFQNSTMTTLNDYYLILSRLLGYENANVFLEDAEALSNELNLNSLGVNLDTVSSRLKYDGVIYTNNGYFILPYSFVKDADNVVMVYFFVDINGTMSVWLNDVNKAKELSRFDSADITEIQNIEVYSRYLLFDTDAYGRTLSLFKPGQQNVGKLNDLYIDKIYIRAVGFSMYSVTQVSSICLGENTSSNVHILSGTLIAEQPVKGFSINGNKTNCSNAANIYVLSNYGYDRHMHHSSGFVNTGTLVNCVNYGNIWANSRAILGLGGSTAINCENRGNIYGNGQLYVSGIGASTATNCRNYGEITSTTYAYAITSGTMVGCVNYGKIGSLSTWGGSIASGIGTGTIKDCVNYGEVNSPNGASSIGIAASANTGIRNCVNYGKVYSKSYSAGMVFRNVGQITNCVNYGDIYGSCVGGILADQYDRDLIIDNCANYGNLYGITASAQVGGIVGYLWGYNYSTSYKPNIIIKNCVVDCGFYGIASKVANFVGFQRESRSTTIENCVVNSHEYLDNDFGFVFGQLGETGGWINQKNIIKNCEINTTAHGKGLNYIVVKNLNASFLINGVVIKEKAGIKNEKLIGSSTGKDQFEALIVEKTDFKFAQGNLQPFSIKWKTGEIGIKTLGNNMFQGEVNAEYLQKKGFEGEYSDFEDDAEEYIELEYIESTGTQYIDTGVVMSDNIEIQAGFKYNSKQNTSGIYDTSLFGVGVSGVVSNFCVFYAAGNSFSVYYNNFNTGIIPTDLEYHEVIFNRNSDRAILLDDDVYGKINATLSNARNLYLFRSNQSNLVTGAQARIYYTRLYNNGNLIRSFIPAKRADGVIGLYDQVEGKFYENQGTGSFVAGPKKSNVPAGYQELEYIESTGTQYIDTGVLAGNATTMDLDVSISNYAECPIIGTDTFKWGDQYAIQVWQNNLYLFDSAYVISNVQNTSRLKIHADPQGVTKVEGFSDLNINRTMSSKNIFIGRWGNTYGAFNLYSLKIYTKDEIIRSFIPAKRNSDGVIGLYDTVEGKFYTNQGTGSFVAGPTV